MRWTCGKRGIAPHIICTGGFKNEPLVCRGRLQALRRRASACPADRVLLADGSTNTIEDARVDRAGDGPQQGWRTAVLVSHPLHLFRARWLFRRAGIDAVTSPTSTDTQRIFLPLRVWYDLREAAAWS